jgi:hypothetical protein
MGSVIIGQDYEEFSAGEYAKHTKNRHFDPERRFKMVCPG